MNKKIITRTSVSAFLLICFFSGLYLIALKSDPYNSSVNFIKRDRTIPKELGGIESQRLALFGYSVRYNGPNGHAEFKIHVRGETGKGTVYINLKKSAGLWNVETGNLLLENGSIVHLSTNPSRADSASR